MQLTKTNRSGKVKRLSVDKNTRKLWDKELPLYKYKGIATATGLDEQTVSNALTHGIATQEVQNALTNFFNRHKKNVA